MNAYKRLDSEISGTLTPSGLTIGGKVTHIAAVDNTAWVPLPATPLAERNAIQIFNRGGSTLYLEFDNGVALGDGIPVAAGGFWASDIRPNIVIYGSTGAGSVKVTVVEEA